MRIVFMGSSEFAVPTLKALWEGGHTLVACYTQPPRPAGRRGYPVRPTPVQRQAELLGIPLHTPVSLKDRETQVRFQAHCADIAVVVAYGLLLPPEILEAPLHGCLNVHASLLPRWRGAAPIHRAVMAGDTETGVAILQMEAGLDTGPVFKTCCVPISSTMSTGELHDLLAEKGAALLREVLPSIIEGRLPAMPQSREGVCYAHKLSKEEGHIRWGDSAQEVHDRIRSLTPVPGAWCQMPIGGNFERVKILGATPLSSSEFSGKILPAGHVLTSLLPMDLVVSCGKGAIRLLQLQRAGRSIVSAKAFLNGVRFGEGTYFK